jgi:hypothetical protein
MMRVKKKCFIKLRICPECGKRCWIAGHPKAERCRKCHKKRKRNSKAHKQRRKQKFGAEKRANRRFCEKVGYCELCGATENLTAHHVGGCCDNKTCLCENCHQAYERWVMKNKVKLWRKNDRRRNHQTPQRVARDNQNRRGI